MTAPPSTVLWDKGLKRFRDTITKRFVSFRDAAERVRVQQVKPGDFRLQDASGRFIGVPQFAENPEFSWISPNKGYVRFSKETKPHAVGTTPPWAVNLVTKYDYYSGGELMGTKHSSMGYGEKYSLEALESEEILMEGYRQGVAQDLGLDIDAIDEVKVSYFEYRYYTPLR